MAETRSGEATIMQLFEAMDHRDEAALASLVTDDFTMSWPQSGERFRGRENALGALSVQGDVPTPEGEPRIVGGGDTWVVMMPLQYPEAGIRAVRRCLRAPRRPRPFIDRVFRCTVPAQAGTRTLHR